MRNIWTIAKREFRAYFTSPMGYVVLACWLLFTGVIFAVMISLPQVFADMEIIFKNATIFAIMFLPLLTMRLLAGEKGGDQGTGTIELLLTAPLTEWQMVLGKYLAAVLYTMVLLAASLIYVLAFEIMGKPDWGKIAGGYVGFLLFSGYVLALGLFYSALTNSQIIAAILTMSTSLVLWLLAYLEQNPNQYLQFLGWFSPLAHHEDFWRGVITLPDVSWFLSSIGMMLYATKLAVTSSRWR